MPGRTTLRRIDYKPASTTAATLALLSQCTPCARCMAVCARSSSARSTTTPGVLQQLEMRLMAPWPPQHAAVGFKELFSRGHSARSCLRACRAAAGEAADRGQTLALAGIVACLEMDLLVDDSWPVLGVSHTSTAHDLVKAGLLEALKGALTKFQGSQRHLAMQAVVLVAHHPSIHSKCAARLHVHVCIGALTLVPCSGRGCLEALLHKDGLL
jgi:hypothetical protein